MNKTLDTVLNKYISDIDKKNTEMEKDIKKFYGLNDKKLSDEIDKHSKELENIDLESVFKSLQEQINELIKRQNIIKKISQLPTFVKSGLPKVDKIEKSSK